MSFTKEAAVGFFVMIGLVCVAYLTIKLGRMEVFNSQGLCAYGLLQFRFRLAPGRGG